MPLLPRAASLLRNLSRKGKVERELSDEVSSYVELLTRAKMNDGRSESEARRAALMELGGTEQVKEQVREVRLGFALDTFFQDLRYAARSLLKKPGFTLTAVATVAIGIGANTAIFSVVNGVLLKALPFPHPERLFALSESSPQLADMAVAYPNYLDWREQQTVFAEMAARMPTGGIISGAGEPLRVLGRLVTASFFPTLEVKPQVGRFFSEAEDQPGGDQVMVLSDSLWRSRFGADPAIIGKAIQYNGGSWTVIGVMPAEFDFYGTTNENNEIFVPLGHFVDRSYLRDRSSHNLRVTARLKPGVTEEKAREELRLIAARLEQQYPESNQKQGIRMLSLLEDHVGETRPALLLLFAVVVLVLLVACANVANLLLAHATVRRREIAVRMALGASRWRVVRLLLTESALLGLAGGAAGLLLATWGISALRKLGPGTLPRLQEIGLDPRVLCFTLVLTLITAIAFGLTPAWETTKTDVQSTLKQAGRQASGGIASRRVRSGLVIAEIAVSLILLVCAGLLAKSLRQLLAVDAGFDARNVLTLRLRLPDLKYTEPTQTVAFLEEAMRRVQSIPGVQRVAVATGFPLGRGSENGYWIEGQPEPKKTTDWGVAVVHSVSEGYHEALRINLLVGRLFNDRDTADSPQIVMVDEDLVRREFPGQPLEGALGKRLKFHEEPWREIVGVTRHVKHRRLDEESRGQIYRPWSQITGRWMVEVTRAMDLIVKSSVDPTSLVPRVKREIQAIDKDQPLGNVTTLQSLLDRSLAPRRFNLFLLTTFSSIGLLLGAIGLYGVMSYTVSQRTHEIGLRMALGAQRRDVFKLVLSEGMLLALAGTALGVAGAFALTRLMASLLLGVSPTDLFTYVSISILIIAVALIACFLPARRASAVNPMEALRYE